jgi:hypothetical protein
MMPCSRNQGELTPLPLACLTNSNLTCVGLCSGKDFMLEAVNVLKGVRFFIYY